MTTLESAYQLTITLMDVAPAIWRRVVVSGSISLDGLHTVVQKAMGWQNAHLYEFKSRGRRYGVPQPDEPEYHVESAWKITLCKAAPVEGVSLSYVYDLGDNWMHEVTVEKITEEPLRHPVCLAGERRCPPEDCGGPEGYAEFWRLSAIRITRTATSACDGQGAASTPKRSTWPA